MTLSFSQKETLIPALHSPQVSIIERSGSMKRLRRRGPKTPSLASWGYDPKRNGAVILRAIGCAPNARLEIGSHPVDQRGLLEHIHPLGDTDE